MSMLLKAKSEVLSLLEVARKEKCVIPRSSAMSDLCSLGLSGALWTRLSE